MTIEKAVSRAPAASSWFASGARSRVAAAMALLLLALVALVGSDSGLRAAALGSGARSAARRHGDPASSHVHRAGRGSSRGRAKFRDDDVSGDSTSSILRNAPGPIPGLVEHVDAEIREDNVDVRYLDAEGVERRLGAKTRFADVTSARALRVCRHMPTREETVCFKDIVLG